MAVPNAFGGIAVEYYVRSLLLPYKKLRKEHIVQVSPEAVHKTILGIHDTTMLSKAVKQVTKNN